MASYDLTTTAIDASTLSEGDILNCPYSGAAVTVSLPEGKYKLEVWGAQGGTYSSYYGGAGGYASGEIALAEETTTLYLYAGGQPATVTTNSSSATSPGGFNGGGAGKVRAYSGTYTYAQGGGGGSDIRIGSDSLYARVIVAGGGGGSASVDALTTKYGGGESGGSPGGTSYIGTQTTAGTGGSFGTGGASGTGGYNYKYGAGGGGGGWYGGGASTSYTDSNTSYRGYNGGGSGYVYTATTVSNYPSGCLLNSTHYLKNASNIAGNVSFTSPAGATETGHTGNGYVRITVLEISGAIKIEGGHDISSENISNLILQVGDILYCGKSNKTFSCQLPGGKYKLEVWGAQGASSDYAVGGLGGYSYGDLTLYSDKTNIYLRVGGKGKKGTSCEGGFNGGGKGYSSYDRIMGSGGGGTDIRLKSDTLYHRVIVAGGGGAAAEAEITPTTTAPYSYGGGAAGGNGAGSADARYGYGGTQTAGGAARTETSWDSAYIETSLKGSFGQGGGAGTNITQYINGAGGGWFGGGAGGPNGGAGGGSGFVYTKESATYTNSTYTGGTWQLNTSHYLENANTIAGNVAFTSPLGESETGHEGNGFIKITVLSTEAPNEFDATKINVGDMDLKAGNIIQCPYSGQELAFNLPSGKYKFECWGAQGGNASDANPGGKGGYSVGEFTSLNNFALYAYVGGQGQPHSGTGGKNPGGFNGGGNGYSSTSSVDSNRCGGGGGTDIRLFENSLFHRVIVAGGGGGNLLNSTLVYTAGIGGGEEGSSGYADTGAKQYKGGTSQISNSYYTPSGFGIGSGYSDPNNTASSTVCGGGGGWFGGGCGNGAGGGSGFVYTKDNDKYTHSAIIGGEWKLNKEHYLENASTQSGAYAFSSPEGVSETGHSGNGYIRITVLSTPFYGTRMGKDKILKMELNNTEIIKAYLGENQVYNINS